MPQSKPNEAKKKLKRANEVIKKHAATKGDHKKKGKQSSTKPASDPMENKPNSDPDKPEGEEEKDPLLKKVDELKKETQNLQNRQHQTNAEEEREEAKTMLDNIAEGIALAVADYNSRPQAQTENNAARRNFGLRLEPTIADLLKQRDTKAANLIRVNNFFVTEIAKGLRNGPSRLTVRFLRGPTKEDGALAKTQSFFWNVLTPFQKSHYVKPKPFTAEEDQQVDEIIEDAVNLVYENHL